MLQNLRTQTNTKCLEELTDSINLLYDNACPMWPTDFSTSYMLHDGRCSNVLHTAWTYHHAIFMSLDHYKKPPRAVHSQWMIMCSRLWYRDSGSST